MEESPYIQRRDVGIKTCCDRTYRYSRRQSRHTRKLHRLEELRDMRGSIHRIIFQENRTVSYHSSRSDCRIISVLGLILLRIIIL